MPQADPFAQRRLLDLAALDRSIGTGDHRRATLPELARIAAAQVRIAGVSSENALADAELSDLDRATRKLDAEVEQVRARAARDAQRLAAGDGNAKDMENLQHEIASLTRRQSSLEDSELELMEQRETVDARVAGLQQQLDEIGAELAAAQTVRDDTFANLTDERTRLMAARGKAIAALPAELVALYERIHAGGRIAAAELRGSRCEACSMQLDNEEVARLRAAGVDEVLRCPECGAILIRS